MERVILHCDMDSYFSTVEEKFNPKLKEIPFAICGDPKMRHSIVMSKNNLAKQAGVLTGISFAQAKEICPQLEYVEADYSKYLIETKFAREIYKKYTDTIIPYGLDESWILKALCLLQTRVPVFSFVIVHEGVIKVCDNYFPFVAFRSFSVMFRFSAMLVNN